MTEQDRNFIRTVAFIFDIYSKYDTKTVFKAVRLMSSALLVRGERSEVSFVPLFKSCMVWFSDLFGVEVEPPKGSLQKEPLTSDLYKEIEEISSQAFALLGKPDIRYNEFIVALYKALYDHCTSQEGGEQLYLEDARELCVFIQWNISNIRDYGIVHGPFEVID